MSSSHASSRSLKVGDTHWVTIVGHHATKDRPAVVLRIDGDYVEVAYCQGSKHDNFPGIEIIADTLGARKLGIKKTSYFRGNNIALVHAEKVHGKVGECLPKLLLKLRSMADEAYRTGHYDKTASDASLSRTPPPTSPASVAPKIASGELHDQLVAARTSGARPPPPPPPDLVPESHSPAATVACHVSTADNSSPAKSTTDHEPGRN